MIQILKLISTVGQALMPFLSFELVGFAAFVLAMTQNALIGIDSRQVPGIQEAPETSE